ncbi:unnamed protein product [Protopolystoma xenopodis]|uniref:Uncharacterized protein n=1 Tax=Protopolystoma xenopodis TaxID=117903 RepID=A0A448XKN8_9PLAT|nr:unnamed protein product [Protopolystoma xenopodis]
MPLEPLGLVGLTQSAACWPRVGCGVQEDRRKVEGKGEFSGSSDLLEALLEGEFARIATAQTVTSISALLQSVQINKCSLDCAEISIRLDIGWS